MIQVYRDKKLPWANAFCEVELPFSVEPQNILKYSWGPVKKEFSIREGETVAQG